MLDLGLDVERFLSGVEKDGVSERWLLRGEGEEQGCEEREGGWETDFPDRTGGFLCFS